MSGIGDVRRLALFAREDVLDAIRERQVYVLGGLFVLVGGGMAYAVGRSVQHSTMRDVELTAELLGPLVMLLPLVTLGLVAPALVEKRSTGALTVLLGLPFSRRTVVLGTLLGRSVVVCASLLSAMGVGLFVGVLMGVPIDPLLFVATALALALLGITFTAIAVSISAMTRTSTRASFVAFGVYVVFVFRLWQELPMIVPYVLRGFQYPETTPAWVEFVAALNPMTAFANALVGSFPSLEAVLFFSPPADPAIYEGPTLALVILVSWIVVTTVLGYHRFRTTDI